MFCCKQVDLISLLYNIIVKYVSKVSVLDIISTFFCCIIRLVEEDLVGLGLGRWNCSAVVVIGILQDFNNFANCKGPLDHQYPSRCVFLHRR